MTAHAKPAQAPLTPHLFMPTPQRPLRAKRQHFSTDMRVVPHRHPWGQLAVSTTGVVRLTVEHGTFIVPPSRAVWIPPGVEHAVSVVEDAELLTLYLHQPRGRFGPQLQGARQAGAAEAAVWRQCRVLEVSELLRALVLELDAQADAQADVQADAQADAQADSVVNPQADAQADGGSAPLTPADLARERRLSALVADELQRARPVPLGVDLPADKRLRALCEAVLDDPVRHTTIDGWARDTGASPRTVARLFRSELGTSFGQWRQQVLLARALSLAARKMPMARIAAELGYASASAFSAMVRRSVGAPPRQFFGAVA